MIKKSINKKSKRHIKDIRKRTELLRHFKCTKKLYLFLFNSAIIVPVNRNLGKLRRGIIMTIDSFSAKDTYQLGYTMGTNAEKGEVYCLSGDLGVGKTVFTQGFAKGLGIDEAVNSPTFTIIQQYEGKRLPLYHFDVYRIADVEEMEEIGYEDYFYGEGVCLIEWAGLIEELLPIDRTTITIKKDLSRGFDYREITVLKQS
jgi:tRNA threonylcarbamoyladenosine biosynthesis protein TsaE